MFQHLDDPKPPAPSATLAERLQAEGGRRRRRRARAVGSGLVGLALLTVAAIRPWDDGDSHVEMLPSDTTVPSTIEEPLITTTTSPEVTTSTPEAAETFPTNAFAAITPDGALVLASIETGEVVRELDRFDAPLGHDVARAQDGSAVYVASAGAELWRYTPDGRKKSLGAAFRVSVSPDGSRLATVPDGIDGSGRVRVLDAATGQVVQDLSITELTGNGDMFPSTVEWDGTGERLLVEASMPEQGGEIFVVDLDGSTRRLGPPDGLPPGTGWYLGGPARAGEAWIMESCCALDANSYDGGRSLLRIDARTGAVVDRVPIGDGFPAYLLLDTGPTEEGFLLLSPAYEGNDAAAILRADVDGTVETMGWPLFLATDW